MVSSEHIHASLDEVMTRWSLVDLINAHETLDLLEGVKAKGNRPKGKGKKR